MNGLANGDLGICTSIDRLTASTAAAKQHRKEVGCFSLEHHAEADGPWDTPGFDLHIVEFDDEGQLWNPELLEATLRRLRVSFLTQQPILISFVHGWKNDAGVCNNNLACFRSMLELAAKAESARARAYGTSPRRVIGLYIGWRGGTIRIPAVKQVTFWGRKHTAHVVGDNGGVSSLVRRVRALVDESRAKYQEDEPGLTPAPASIWIGHSFGAALLYSALSTSINADVGEALQLALRPSGLEPPNSPACRDVAMPRTPKSGSLPETVYLPTRGDVVVLVNPAFEASRFSNINQTRAITFHPCQVPTLITLASEGDTAVGGFFPLGQSFSTVFRAARSRPVWLSMAQGIGMYRPYHTHRLELRAAPAGGGAHPIDAAATVTCGCKTDFRANGDAVVDRLLPLYRHLAADGSTVAPLAAAQEYVFSQLTPVTEVDANNPFMTIQVDRRIIGDHGDVFNSRFLAFVLELMARIDHKRYVIREDVRSSN